MTTQLPLIPSGRTSVVRHSRGDAMREGCVTANGDIYVGRGRPDPREVPIGEFGYMGNPFKLTEHGQRAMPLFETYFIERWNADGAFWRAVSKLRGRNLRCWCLRSWDTSQEYTRRCHAQVIALVLDAKWPGARKPLETS